ncbi:hypothetical protein [Novosphingobium panipatense]|uniref:hypothetical protein n=1 Tax=Novosphingobium panipatense TaxID=428991 RepID=UPI00360DB52D
MPEPLDHLDRLFKAADRLGEVEAVRNRVLQLTGAEAQNEAPLGQVADRQGRLRQEEGWRRTVSTTVVASGVFRVSTAAAAATAIPSR